MLLGAVPTQLNVAWSRTNPIIVSVGDDAYQTYLTLECDHTMGMTVVGSLKNMILFNYACSSSISAIEYGIMGNLAFSYQYSDSGKIGSVTLDLLRDYYNGTDLEVFNQNGCIIIKLMGCNDLILLYDPETGIVRDINTLNSYCGAYCFPDIQTELAYDFFNNAKNTASSFKNWAQYNLNQIRFYQFSGWKTVGKRLEYGGVAIIKSMVDLMEDPFDVSAWHDFFDGLSEYYDHLGEVGSIDVRIPTLNRPF